MRLLFCLILFNSTILSTCLGQVNVACTNFTYEGKKSQIGTSLRKTFEASLSKSNLPFRLIEREDISQFFEKLQEEKNLYKDLFKEFNKKPELAGVDYLVVGNVESSIATEKYSLSINFIKLTGNDATMKLPLLIILSKDQIMDDAQVQNIFISEINTFADNYFIIKKNGSELTKIPDFYKELEKRDSTIKNLSSSVIELQKENETKDIQINQLGKDISNIKEFTSVAPLNILGLPQDPGGSLKYTSGISLLMQNVWDFDKSTNMYHIRYTDSALYYSNLVIDKFPNFPFGFYSKVLILRSRNRTDQEVLVAVKRAIEILKITTTIYGHNGAHDQALAELKKVIIYSP